MTAPTKRQSKDQPSDPSSRISPLPPEDLYKLTEIKVLQEIEAKFFEILTRKIKIWGITVAVAAFIATVFGVSSFWSQIHQLIDTTVKSQIDQRMASEFPRLENRIDNTFESGILAKNASETAVKTIDTISTKLTEINLTLTDLKDHTENASNDTAALQAEINQQSNNIASLGSIVKNWFNNSKADRFEFSKGQMSIVKQLNNGSTLLCFVLNFAPIQGSIRLEFNLESEPPGSFFNINNVVFFSWGEHIDILSFHPLYATYVADPTSTNIIHTVTIHDGSVFGDSKPILEIDKVNSNGL